MSKLISDVLDHTHQSASDMATCRHMSCIKRRAGICGFVGCGTPAWYQLIHTAELVTVVDNSAGEDSIRRGAPAPDAKIDKVRLQRVCVEIACSQHVEQLMEGAKLLLVDVVLERLGPEAHGERRRR